MSFSPFDRTPLWPAGHLPLKGGDWAAWMLSQNFGHQRTKRQLISPLEGEMAGRPEGGVQRARSLTAPIAKRTHPHA